MSYPTRPAPGLSSSLGRTDLLRMLRWMLLARELDEAELRLLRQQRAYFNISGAGHEAVQAAAGLLLRPGRDWFFPYYRDRTLCLALGVSPTAMLLQAMGKAADPSSGGRQMPSHWGDVDLNIVSQSSPTGMQYLPAVGAAEVPRLASRMPAADDRPVWEADELVFVSGGEGSTSQGEFYESLNVAVMRRLPVFYLIEDNEYAISVPVEDQTPVGSISRFLRGIPGLLVVETDGLDVLRSYQDLSRATSHVRSGLGPALVHAHVVRSFPHSNSDDHGDYRSEEELERLRSRDPIPRYCARLLDEEVLTEVDLAGLVDDVRAEVQAAVAEAEASPEPEVASISRHLYAPEGTPGGIDGIEPIPEVSFHKRVSLEQIVPPEESMAPGAAGGSRRSGKSWTLLEAIRFTLVDEMARDARIVVFGEDVADASRAEVLRKSRGKGGVFKVTHGLQRRFGERRVFNSPLAEAAIVGRAIGMAVRGLRPVVEIQFFDYIWPAMMQIRNELALLRWRSDGHFFSPVVVRVPIGAYLRGGGVYHSQSGEAIFCHCPGLRVVMPSNARDAVGLLRTAIRRADPVLFLEHKHLYRQPHTRRADPGPEFVVPFGKASVVRPGRDVTLVTYGALVHRAAIAAGRLAEDGIEVEILDLRSLKPWDFEAVAASARRTSRLVVASEETADFGVAAEIAARAAEELFLDLDAPVRRLGALDTPVAYCPSLEEATLPQVHDIERVIRETVAF